MATRYNYTGQLITDGLVLNLDAAKRDSYPGSGTTWYDLSGDRNNGTLTNGPTYTGVSKDAAIVFDGVDDYIQTNLPTTAINSDQVSICVAFKSTFGVNNDASNHRGIISSGDLWTNGFSFYLRSTTNASFSWGVNGTHNRLETNFSDTIYYFVGTYNGEYIRSYLNGTFIGQTSATGSVNMTAPMKIGYVGGLSGDLDYFGGEIYSVMVYNKALSDSEITQNFNALRGRYGI